MKISKRSLPGYIRHQEVKLENNLRTAESREELLEELDPSDIYIYSAIAHELETAKSNVKHLGKQINHLRGEQSE